VWIGMALIALPAAQGQPAKDTIPAAKLLGSSPRVAARLTAAQAKADQAQWAEAIAEYQTILDDHGDELTPLDPKNPDHCVSVRHLCHLRIAALPAEALKLYRARVDEPAKKRLEQATPARDEALLRRLIEEAFCSGAAEQALDWLGDLAFERGDFAAAERCWSLLALSPTQAVSAKEKKAAPRLLYPSPQGDVALIRAKQILALLFRGDQAAAVEELKAFQALHPKSEGHFAGRNGNYLQTLQTFADKKQIGAGLVGEAAWRTFGGAPSRNPPFVPLPNCRWLEEPWHVRLDGKPADDKPEMPAKPLTASENARRLAFQPAIIGDRVIVADSRCVNVFDLLNGRRRARFDLFDDAKHAGLKLDVTLPVKHDERYTVSIADDRIYARLGTTGMAYPAEAKDGAVPLEVMNSVLVCLDLSDAHDKLPVRWQVASRSNDKDIALFEGAPLVHEGRAYLARMRFTPSWCISEIDCYDALTGVRHWRQQLCEGQELTKTGESRYQQQLLTLAGPNIVYCSHSGAIAAVDAASGKRVWAVRYPRRLYQSTNGTPNPRELCPCVYSAGRVYAAPADCDRILCLDAYTGRTLWESKPLEVVNLLGIAKGRLIFTTGSFPRGIRALDAVRGTDQRGWLQPEDGQDELPTVGRGLFAGNVVLWPTRKRLWVLNQEDGSVAQPESVALAAVPPGNLAVGSGCLVVATDKELLGYVAPARKLEQRRKEANAQPQSMEALHRLAVAQADAGLPDEDGKYLRYLDRSARAPSIWGGMAEGHREPRQRYEALLEFARQAATANDWTKAASYYQRVVPTDLTSSGSPWQLAALMEQAERWERARKPDEAIQAWQRILGSPMLRSATLVSPEGTWHPAGPYAARQIEQIIKMYGRGSYDLWDKHALSLRKTTGGDWEQFKRNGNVDMYPNAQTIREAVARRIDEADKAQDYRVVAEWCRWQVRYAEDSLRATAAKRLERAYEGMHKAQLAQAKQAESSRLSVPLKESWKIELAQRDSEHRLPLEPVGQAAGPATASAGQRPAPQDSLFFVRNERVLSCRDAVAGKLRWASDIGVPVSWLGSHADLILAGGRGGVVALSRANGQLAWAFLVPTWPFVVERPTFAAFRLVGGRLFLLSDQRCLVCLDVDTGQVLWTRWAPSASIEPLEPGGRFQPSFLATATRVWIQTSAGKVWLLDSATGRTLRESGSERRSTWRNPPLLLSEREACIVPDGQHMSLVDLSGGKEIWKHEVERRTSLSGEAPQVLAQGANILLCVARNYGYEVDRLDPATGQRRWAKPILFAHGKPQLSLAAVDETAFYVATGQQLGAFALSDGARLWELPLPGATSDWQVVRSGAYVLAWPVHALPEWQPAVLVKRCLFTDPSLLVPTQAPLAGAWRTGLAVWAAESVAPSHLPVLVCAAKDGRVLQRLNFTGQGPTAAVRVVDRRLIVTTTGVAWGLQ
jgi:outer membrane protein assembly factor BamB